MIISRRENAKKNIFSGIINKVVSLGLPFVLNYIFIRTLGVEYLGVDGLFKSILTVLALSELGVGSAISFCMYKPIAEDDDDEICALLNLYKKLYRIIGLFIFSAGMMLLPFLPGLVKGSYPADLNINIIYFLFLLRSSISYWMFSYKQSLLEAYQRTDIILNINTLVTITLFFIQTAFLFNKNYYAYLIASLVSVVLSNLFVEFRSRKLFPQLQCRGKISKARKKELSRLIKGIIISKITVVTRNGFDNIFTSLFVGLTATAIYNNYFAVYNALFSLLSIISNSLTGGIGNAIALKSKEENYREMRILDFAFMMGACAATVCLYCLYQPFMRLWMGENIFPDFTALVFTGYFFLNARNVVWCLYLVGRGLYWEYRYEAVIEMIMNIALNYFLGKRYGALGIVSATFISLFIMNFYSIWILFKNYFKGGMSAFLLNQLRIAVLTVALCAVSGYFCSLVHYSGFVGLFVRLGICVFIITVVYVILFLTRKKYKETCVWVIRQFKRN